MTAYSVLRRSTRARKLEAIQHTPPRSSRRALFKGVRLARERLKAAWALP